MRLLMTRDSRRGLGGFGHLAQYTVVSNAPGPSNFQNVMNRFVPFKFFAEQIEEEETSKQYPPASVLSYEFLE
jgi:hypothetical protein